MDYQKKAGFSDNSW